MCVCLICVVCVSQSRGLDLHVHACVSEQGPGSVCVCQNRGLRGVHACMHAYACVSQSRGLDLHACDLCASHKAGKLLTYFPPDVGAVEHPGEAARLP